MADCYLLLVSSFHYSLGCSSGGGTNETDNDNGSSNTSVRLIYPLTPAIH